MEQLRNLLLTAFPGSELDIEELPFTDQRLGGMVVWDGFDLETQHERQQRLWDVIRTGVSPEILKRIGPILTLTHDERLVNAA